MGRRGVSAEGLMGPLEYDVLRELWSSAPANVQAVLDRVNAERSAEDQLAYTTVMTVMARLHEKGIADRTRVGRGYAYTPNFDEPALVEHLGRAEVDRIVERFGPVALAQFAAVLEDADPALVSRLRKEADRG